MAVMSGESELELTFQIFRYGQYRDIVPSYVSVQRARYRTDPSLLNVKHRMRSPSPQPTARSRYYPISTVYHKVLLQLKHPQVNFRHQVVIPMKRKREKGSPYRKLQIQMRP